MNTEVSLFGASFQVSLKGDAAFCDIDGHRVPSFWSHATRGLWEPETFAAINQCCTSDTAFVDVGAWIGPLSLYAATRVAQVYSFEPDPIAFQKLVLNLAANPELRINAKPLAVSRNAKPVPLYSQWAGDSQASVFSMRERGSRLVRAGYIGTAAAVDLQATIKGVASTHPHIFLKIDIEGGEYSLLDGLTNADLRPVRWIHLSLHPENIVSDLFRDADAARGLRQQEASRILPLLMSCKVYRVAGRCWSLYPPTEIQSDLERLGSPAHPLLLEL